MRWLIDELEERVQLYTFFCTFFREKPSPSCLGLAIKYASNWCQNNNSEESDEDRRLFTMIQRQVVEVVKERGLSDYIDFLSQEYERLFYAPGRVLVTLYESAYFGNGLLMQERTIRVRQHYLESGLVVKSLYIIPDDHLSIELDFMQRLTQRILDLLYNGGDREDVYKAVVKQRNFLQEHLVPWVPKLAEGIRTHSTDPFYRLLVMGLQLLLEDTVETLDWLIEKPLEEWELSSLHCG